MANVNDKKSLIKSQLATFRDLLQKKRPAFEGLLPAHIKTERVLMISLQALSKNPELLECDQVSVMACLMQCAALGLEPNTILQEAWLVPFYNKKRRCKEAQFIAGYPGLIKLMRQSPLVAGIAANC